MSKRNENRPGYKKTKAGWIPDQWHCVFLSDVATIQTGLAKGKKNIKNPIELPYLRVANVQDGFLYLDNVKKIQIEANKVERYLLRKTDHLNRDFIQMMIGLFSWLNFLFIQFLMSP